VGSLAAEHASAVVFFLVLLAFELVRRRAPPAFRHPMYVYLGRGAIAAAFFAASGVDPLAWFTRDAASGIVIGIVLGAALVLLRRDEARALAAAAPAMLVQAAYLALVVAAVEELIFRGAFVLVAAVTPLAAVLASLGSAVAYAIWRAVAWRERDPRVVVITFIASVGLGLVTALAGSLWPGLIAHAALVLLVGPARPSTARG